MSVLFVTKDGLEAYDHNINGDRARMAGIWKRYCRRPDEPMMTLDKVKSVEPQDINVEVRTYRYWKEGASCVIFREV